MPNDDIVQAEAGMRLRDTSASSAYGFILFSTQKNPSIQNIPLFAADTRCRYPSISEDPVLLGEASDRITLPGLAGLAAAFNARSEQGDPDCRLLIASNTPSYW